MKRVLVLGLLPGLLLAATLTTLAQSGGEFSLSWSSLGGGGGSAGGEFSLEGTIGQAGAGPELAGGDFKVTGGFWGGTAAPAPVMLGDSSFVLHQHPADGATGVKIGISAVFDPDTGNDVAVLLGDFQAQLTYDGSCVNIPDVRELDFAITDINIDNDAGLATFSASAPGGVAAPVDLGHALTRLTGSADQQCQVDLELTSLSDVDGNPVAAPTVLTQTVQRGDARADGVVNIADALFIAQYLVGLRPACTDTVDTICLHPVNAASVRQDGAFDKKTIADALFIAQYLVGLRDEFYNLVP